MRAWNRSLTRFLFITCLAAGVALAGERARADLGPGCHPETPAIAHHGDAAVLDPQPAGGPIPCRTYTGYAGGESRIEVGADGGASWDYVEPGDAKFMAARPPNGQAIPTGYPSPLFGQNCQNADPNARPCANCGR